MNRLFQIIPSLVSTFLGLVLLGCATNPTDLPQPPEKVETAPATNKEQVSTQGTEFSGIGDFAVSVMVEFENRVSTYEELVQVTTAYSQYHGKKEIKGGKFILDRGTPREHEVIVVPLTLEALKKSGVVYKDGDWLHVYLEK